jgi:hypothetical protein
MKKQQLINFLMEELTKSEKENILLKARGKFGVQQANYTMKRLVERIGNYIIKEKWKKTKTDIS